jgi:hypothetical protein
MESYNGKIIRPMQPTRKRADDGYIVLVVELYRSLGSLSSQIQMIVLDKIAINAV